MHLANLLTHLTHNNILERNPLPQANKRGALAHDYYTISIMNDMDLWRNIDLKCVCMCHEDHGSPHKPAYRPQRTRGKAKEWMRE